MTRVAASYRDGRSITWTDGELGGDRILLRYLASPPRPTGAVTPEGPVLELRTYREDPWAFVAAAQLIHPSDCSPVFSMRSMPPLS